MGGLLITTGTSMLCPHSGQAQPLGSNARVKVGGQPVLTQINSCTIKGCPLSPPSSSPCISAVWLNGTMRVKAGGIPIISINSQSLISPIPASLAMIPNQFRVKGQ